MNKKDEQFFEKHWEEWVRRNPPPDYWGSWGSTKKQYAELEMPCRGFFGKLFFELDRWLTRKKSL